MRTNVLAADDSARPVAAGNSSLTGLLFYTILLAALILTYLVVLQQSRDVAAPAIVIRSTGAASTTRTGAIGPDGGQAEIASTAIPTSSSWPTQVPLWFGALGGVTLLLFLSRRAARGAPLLADWPALTGRTDAQLWRSAPVGLLMLDPDERIRYVNAAGRQLLGFHPGVAAGGRLDDCGCLPELAGAIRRLRGGPASSSPGGSRWNGVRAAPPAAAASAEPNQAAPDRVAPYQADQAAPEPAPASVSVEGLRLTPLAGGPARLFSVLIEDRAHERQFERRRDEFLAQVAHEMRTPLTCIQAYAESLKSDLFDDPPTRQRCYEVIMRETQRLTDLIDDVLNLSQIEAGAAAGSPVTVPLHAALREAVEELQPQADAKSIQLVRYEAAEEPVVLGEWARLQQVWTNLLSNAIKYSPAGARVSVRIGRTETTAWVEVRDAGPGIDPAYQQRIFEKFFRAPAAEIQAQPGVGLGLALVREIVRRHRGAIQVRSQPGAGATFRVELPLAAASLSESDEERAHGSNRAG